MKKFFAIIIAIFTANALAVLTPLPVGNTGIAAQYPNDAGIAGSSAVVFSDNFEGYAGASNLSSRWNGGVYHYVDLVTSGAYSGKSLRFTNPQQSAELSNTCDRLVNPELDVLFLRYYTKFDATFNATGSSHNGCSIQASYAVNGQSTPGVPANGYNKFLANLECWRDQLSEPSPGRMNTYIYHPEQRDVWGDHFFPTGVVIPWDRVPGNFGPDFVSRPDITPQLNRWYCVEFMVRANTPGLRDGRIAAWLDGALIADFPNLRLRDIDTLKIDRFGVSSHIKSNTNNATYMYYDNVVAATSYIGPVRSGTPAEPAPAAVLNPAGPADVAIYSLDGRLLKKEETVHIGHAALCDLEKGLPAGLYVWLIRQGAVRQSVKRVVMR